MKYFAPLNKLSNFVYRHLMLKYGADYVFSELIMLDRAIRYKLNIIDNDKHKTIFQLGVASTKDISKGVQLIDAKEFNINMGCPHSTLIKKKVCGGLLHDQVLMKKLSEKLYEESKNHNFIPSVKLRIGLDKDTIQIKDYLKIIESSGIKKVYVHARPLRYSYQKPAMIDEVIDLPKLFPNLNIIFNGDIDSYITAKNYPGDIMIGCAALHNPFVFQDIDYKLKTKKDHFDFCNDPHLIHKNGNTYFSEEKLIFIKELLDLAELHNLDFHLLKNNLVYLSKGVTGDLIKKLHQVNSIKELNNLY